MWLMARPKACQDLYKRQPEIWMMARSRACQDLYKQQPEMWLMARPKGLSGFVTTTRDVADG
jgi:hypothetical protein